MEISLDQAIEIHARALRAQRGPDAPGVARRKARGLADAGDHEGHGIWLKVAELEEGLPDRTPD